MIKNIRRDMCFDILKNGNKISTIEKFPQMNVGMCGMG